MRAATESSGLLRRGLRLEYATLSWNVLEVGLVAVAAILARSVALARFGLDSCIEIFASLVVVWQIKGTATPEREQRAVRLIGVAVLGLALFLIGQTAVPLALGVRPESSLLGIGSLAATTVVMFSLAAAKGRTGRALGNRTLQTEAKVTMVDGALAATILVGLVLNAAFGWWWADLAGGVIIIGYGLPRGAHALRGSG